MGRNLSFSYSEAFLFQIPHIMHNKASVLNFFFCSKDFQFRNFFQNFFPHFFSFKKSKFATEPIEIFFAFKK